MRQIKFRAWDYQAKRMVHGLPRVCVKGDVGTEHGYTICDIDVFDGRFVLMQFTGLHDRNGKEIWEGDVVLAECEDDMEYVSEDSLDRKFTDGAKKVVVEWDERTGYFLPSELAFDEFCPRYDDDDIRVEVIGNVFENPELLK